MKCSSTRLYVGLLLGGLCGHLVENDVQNHIAKIILRMLRKFVCVGNRVRISGERVSTQAMLFSSILSEASVDLEFALVDVEAWRRACVLP